VPAELHKNRMQWLIRFCVICCYVSIMWRPGVCIDLSHFVSVMWMPVIRTPICLNLASEKSHW
jgi:NADH:ubiquinone oxidoreductase subunit B-like Fe-S oxidoreductase